MKRLAAFLFSALLFCGCGSAPKQPASVPAHTVTQPQYDADTYAQPIVLVLAMSGSDASLNGIWAAMFRDHVQSASQGRLQIRVFGEGELGSDLEVFEDCRYGTVDLQIVSASALQTVFPETGIFDLPFLFTDIKTVRNHLKEPLLTEYLEDAAKKHGTVLLNVSDHGFRNLSSRTPLTSVEDFRTMTLRCMNNETHEAFWNAIGCSTTSMDISDVYLALQKGGIQAEENNYDQIYTNRLYELQKYITNSEHLPDIKLLLSSKITWDSLSPPDQALLQNAAELCQEEMPAIVDAANRQALTSMLREGCRLTDLDLTPQLKDHFREVGLKTALSQPGLSGIPSGVLDIWMNGSE